MVSRTQVRRPARAKGAAQVLLEIDGSVSPKSPDTDSSSRSDPHCVRGTKRSQGSVRALFVSTQVNHGVLRTLLVVDDEGPR